MAGQYTFAFSNMKDKVYNKEVTVAIHPGYEEDKKTSEDAQLAKDFIALADSTGV
jgi:hypothetical protein